MTITGLLARGGTHAPARTLPQAKAAAKPAANKGAELRARTVFSAFAETLKRLRAVEARR